MSKTMAVYVYYNSFPSSAKQPREMTKFYGCLEKVNHDG